MSDAVFLRRAITKVKRFNGTQWAGYLTSADIVALADLGIRERDSAVVQRSRKDVEAGKIVPNWFYFTPTGALLDAIRKAHPKEFQ